MLAETGSSGVSERACFKAQGEELSRKTLRLPSGLHVGTRMWVYTRERVSTPPLLYIKKEKKKELSLSVGHASLSASGPQQHRQGEWGGGGDTLSPRL